MSEPKYDEIGYWSEIKLDIIKDYAAAYSRILRSQKKPSLYHIYIDAFAGAGKHISKKTGTFVLGSPMNALLVEPPFREYHFGVTRHGSKMHICLQSRKNYLAMLTWKKFRIRKLPRHFGKD